MDVFDELRYAIDLIYADTEANSSLSWDDMMRSAIDSCEAGRPGLVDTTTQCENCKKLFARADTKIVFTHGPTGAGYMATLCTTCADTLDMYEWYGFANHGFKEDS